MLERIVASPDIHVGKSYVVGTRITVQNVLELVEQGLSFAEISKDYYPELSIEDIRACLLYATALVAASDRRRHRRQNI